MPHLVELVERHKDDPFALIGINFRDSPEDFRAGVEKYKVSWLSAFLGNEIALVELYAVQGFPTYLVLDVDGKIVHRGGRPDEIDKVVADLLAKVDK